MVDWRASVVLPLSLLAACADPPAQQAAQAREDARLRVLGDAIFYWRCEHHAVARAGECDQWSEAFKRDRAAFVATYGSLSSGKGLITGTPKKDFAQ